MAKKHHPKSFWHRIRFKYKLVILNELTLLEIWSFRLSQLSLIVYLGVFAFALVVLTSAIIVLTPIRNYLPGYLDVEIREEMLNNAMRADSLYETVQKQSLYLDNLTAILLGNITIDSLNSTDSVPAPAQDYEIPRSERETAFVERLEHELRDTLDILHPQNGESAFHIPLKGQITAPFDEPNRHFGLDIAAPADAKILATLDGDVIYAGFDSDFGNIITVQHANGIVSIYMHNRRLLKKTGDRVHAGEPLAIIGNTGKLATGIRLHFEIWHKGVALDPATLMSF